MTARSALYIGASLALASTIDDVRSLARSVTGAILYDKYWDVWAVGSQR